MKRSNLKVLRNFYNYSASNLVIFGYNVGKNLDPLIYLHLPFAPGMITTMTDTLNAAQVATLTGGTEETAARNIAFSALANALNSDANIVETVVGMNLDMLLATGYLPVSSTRAATPLSDTAILGLTNNGATSALLRLLPVANAKTYQVQTSLDAGVTWVELTPSPQARRIVLNGLVTAKTYAVRARAIGGSTGASNWTPLQFIVIT